MVRYSVGSYFFFNIRTQRLWIRKPHLHCCSLGQKVAFLTPNSSEYVVAQWAVWMCGGVVVPLCQSHPLDALRYIGVMSSTPARYIHRNITEEWAVMTPRCRYGTSQNLTFLTSLETTLKLAKQS